MTTWMIELPGRYMIAECDGRPRKREVSWYLSEGAWDTCEITRARKEDVELFLQSGGAISHWERRAAA